MNHMNSAPACKCGHHKVFPLIIILLGLLFLLGALNVFSAHFVSIVWPILVIILGLTKWKGGHCKCYMQAPSAM